MVKSIPKGLSHYVISVIALMVLTLGVLVLLGYHSIYISPMEIFSDLVPDRASGMLGSLGLIIGAFGLLILIWSNPGYTSLIIWLVLLIIILLITPLAFDDGSYSDSMSAIIWEIKHLQTKESPAMLYSSVLIVLAMVLEAHSSRTGDYAKPALLSIAIICLAFLALRASSIDVGTVEGLALYIQMPIYISYSFMLLGYGFLLHAYLWRTKGEYTRWLPLALGLVLLTATFALKLSIVSVEKELATVLGDRVIGIADSVILAIGLLLTVFFVLITWFAQIARNRARVAIRSNKRYKYVLAQRKQIEQELRINQDVLESKVEQRTGEYLKAKQAAEDANSAKGDFLANMSHEIRTPMNAVIGLSHLLLDTKLNNNQRDFQQKILGAAESLLGIINDILDFSKIESGKLDMETIDFSLEDTLNNLASVGGVKASEKDLDFLYDYPPGLPLLKGDPLRLGQILLNLVNNAVKFTEKGEITVSIEVAEQSETSIQLRFAVTDSGIGMNEKQLSRLFQSFSQADASTTRKYGGTGLGLAISKQLVELMEGEIGVTSTLGEGSCFYFTASFGLGDQLSDHIRENIPEQLDGLRVLIVDDNSTARNILERQVDDFGFSSVQVSSAKQAIEMLEGSLENPFDLVLMDWKMPGMDGIEASRRIKKSKIKPMPKLILVTAYGRQESRMEAEKVGMDGFLVKPINPSILMEAIQSAFHLSCAKETPQEAERRISNPEISNIRGAHLLLAEDNELNQQVAEGLLAKVGVTVRIVSNGKEAIEAVENETFDGVLMDLQMPVMDGLKATHILREDDRFREIPILAMTANVMAGDLERCIEVGMNDHIAKPIDPNALYAKLATWIQPSNPMPAGDEVDLDKAQQQNDEEIPSIEGIDIEEGLMRVGEDSNMYQKILHKFFDSQADALTLIRKSLASNDIEIARRLAHTLKGVSGSIGARALHEEMKKLDAALKEPNNVDKQLFERVDEELNIVVNGLRRWRESQVAKATSVSNIEDAVPIIKEMRELIEDNDGDAADLIDDLQASLAGSNAEAHIFGLQKHLNVYDFTAALGVITQIEKAYDNSEK